MRREISYLNVVAVAAPLAISAPQQHVTEIRVGGGSGSYAVVTRGCEGVISSERASYDNAALEVSHKFPQPIRLGARVGFFQPDFPETIRLGAGEDRIRYANPFVSFDWPMFSIGVGLVRANSAFPFRDGDGIDGTVSGHIRIGKPKTYFSAGYFEEVPLATPGFMTAGFGGGGRKLQLWFGAGIAPYDVVGFVATADYRIGGGIALGATGRLGGTQGISENAFAFRLSYQWSHGRPPSADSTGQY